MAMGIDLEKQVTYIIGDNVNHNKAIANHLGLPQGKCIPHALALIVKNGYLQLPLAKALLLDAGSIISAGGTGKRREELKSEPYKLDPNMMIVYTNRFADVTAKAQYRFANFAYVQH